MSAASGDHIFFAANDDGSEFYRWRDGRLIQALIEPAAGFSQVGAIHLGRVLRIEKGLNAAFVEIGEKQPGLLPLKRHAALTEGQAVVVEIRRDGRAAEGKGPRLSIASAAAAALAGGRAPPALLQPPPPLWRQALAVLEPPEIAAIVAGRRLDAARLVEAYPALADRVVFQPERDWSPDRAALEEALAAALEPEVPLPGGGRLTIEPTRALTVIDIDSAAAMAGTFAETALAVNLAAVAEIPRQLALRNVGGITVVDCIDIDNHDRRRQVAGALREAAAPDPAIDYVGAMSRLGLIEIRRRRKGPSLADMLALRREPGRAT